jgi:hypothetical protein
MREQLKEQLGNEHLKQLVKMVTLVQIRSATRTHDLKEEEREKKRTAEERRKQTPEEEEEKQRVEETKKVEEAQTRRGRKSK